MYANRRVSGVTNWSTIPACRAQDAIGPAGFVKSTRRCFRPIETRSISNLEFGASLKREYLRANSLQRPALRVVNASAHFVGTRIKTRRRIRRASDKRGSRDATGHSGPLGSERAGLIRL